MRPCRRSGALVEPEEQLFDGGPVEPASVVVLADFLDSVEGRGAGDGVDRLPAARRPATTSPRRSSRARVYAGYAGWGPGQLEAELQEESWVSAPALPGDVFHGEPARLWDDVLRRLGRDYDMLRLMPRDPSMN